MLGIIFRLKMYACLHTQIHLHIHTHARMHARTQTFDPYQKKEHRQYIQYLTIWRYIVDVDNHNELRTACLLYSPFLFAHLKQTMRKIKKMSAHNTPHTHRQIERQRYTHLAINETKRKRKKDKENPNHLLLLLYSNKWNNHLTHYSTAQHSTQYIQHTNCIVAKI